MCMSGLPTTSATARWQHQPPETLRQVTHSLLLRLLGLVPYLHGPGVELDAEDRCRCCVDHAYITPSDLVHSKIGSSIVIGHPGGSAATHSPSTSCSLIPRVTEPRWLHGSYYQEIPGSAWTRMAPDGSTKVDGPLTKAAPDFESIEFGLGARACR